MAAAALGKLKEAISNVDLLNKAAAKFANDAIKNGELRKRYVAETEKMSRQMLRDGERMVETNQSLARNTEEFLGGQNRGVKVFYDNMVWKKVATEASNLRNVLLSNTRDQVSRGGRLFSKAMKEEGLSFEKLMDKYAKRDFNTEFANLNKSQQTKVLEVIAAASGRTNARVNFTAEFSKKLGQAWIVVTLFLAVNNARNDENPSMEFVNQMFKIGASRLGSSLGSSAGGNLEELIGEGTGPVGTLAVALLGNLGGGVIGATLAEGTYKGLCHLFAPNSDA